MTHNLCMHCYFSSRTLFGKRYDLGVIKVSIPNSRILRLQVNIYIHLIPTFTAWNICLQITCIILKLNLHIRLYQLCLHDSGSQKVDLNFKHLNNVVFILLIMLNLIKQTEPKTQYSHDELVWLTDSGGHTPYGHPRVDDGLTPSHCSTTLLSLVLLCNWSIFYW